MNNNSFILNQTNITPLDKKLISSVKSGCNCKTISKFCRQGANPNAKDEEGKTVLMHAIHNGMNHLISYLVSKSDINATDSNGRTALFYSIFSSNVYGFNVLLSKGANPNIKDKEGRTLLHFAVILNKKKAFNKLIKENVFFNEKDIYDKTALDYALEKGDEYMSYKLIEIIGYTNLSKGSIIKILIDVAINDKIDDLKKLMRNGINPNNIKDKEGRTPLHYAVILGKKKVFDKLTEGNNSINEKDNYGNTPLNYAFEHGYKEMLYKLILKGADINTLGYNNLGEKNITRVLMEVVINNETNVLEKLIEDGIDVNSQFNFNQTALMFAIENNEEKTVKTLLLAGANPNAVDYWGSRPIHYAATIGNEDIITSLVLHGAKVNIKNEDDKKPSEIARENGLDEIADYLEMLETAEIEKEIEETNQAFESIYSSDYYRSSVLLAEADGEFQNKFFSNQTQVISD